MMASRAAPARGANCDVYEFSAANASDILNAALQDQRAVRMTASGVHRQLTWGSAKSNATMCTHRASPLHLHHLPRDDVPGPGKGCRTLTLATCRRCAPP
jgi:hypothetical protein